MSEIYVEIDGFPDYAINESGDVYSIRYNRILTHGVSADGYLRIRLYNDGKGCTKTIHRLLAKTFIHNPTHLPCIDHIDHDRQNNSLDNLRWCSISTNNRNKSISKKNTSGVQGVRFDKINQRWKAQWCEDGKQKSKCFSLKKYDDAFDLACKYREYKVKELYNRK